jgi:hypothetical protein
MAAVAPHHAGGHGLLLAVLLAVAFGVAAWLQPAASSLCAACRGPKGSGVDFCVTCGAPRPAAERA